MKPDLQRLKSDIDTIQKAMGLSPSLGQDWLQWMKRYKWLPMWWCLPGSILIAAAVLPLDATTSYGGLLPSQWAGLLVAATILCLAYVHGRIVTTEDGRSEGMIRESKRINGLDAQGMRFGAALLVQLGLYFWWGAHSQIPREAFWSGLFLLIGSSCVIAAVVSRVWTVLGWGLPFIAYGIAAAQVYDNSMLNGIFFGAMFIAVALSFSLITVLQIRQLERQHVAKR